MCTPQIRGFLYGVIITTSLVSVVTYASTDGIFGDYFERMTGYCIITGLDPKVLTGLADNLDGPPFGTKRCTSLKSLIGNIFGSTSAPVGQAIVGFNPDGSPLYGDVNWHNSGADIAYTGGNVGIGTSTPNAKLDVNGNIKGSNIRGGTLFMNGTNTLGSDWRMHIQSTENLYLNPFAGEVIVGGGGGPGKISANQVCIGADCRTSWGGGGTLINMYQCPGIVSLGGGAWGYYGCQNQIQNQPTCYEIEWPNSQVFACTYIGKMRLEP